ncbi:Sodium/calcium exchanger 2 [Acipenser ruthenus]|uniref:Sodium/calcium exchanger 2 n=1 Tax=Acipenser ruthenus TaxID=7906 RepID=A0A444U4H9_ACIRT|nr:Sodium/calcium exchanger 2 [Acipenser ruthenus]
MGPGLSRASPSLSPSLVLSDSDAGGKEGSRNRSSCSDPVQCRPGILLPVWEPKSPSLGDKVARSLVYFVALVYMFLGVSIIADRFMASIEVITSQVIRILKDLKLKHPDRDLEQLVETANYQALVQQQKSRAFYRIQATRMMIGAGNVLKKHAADQHRRGTDLEGMGGVPGAEEGGPDSPPCSLISFERPHYQCVENCGRLALTVVCHGGEGLNTFYVDYRTEDGSARAGSDYEYREGTLSTVDKLIKKTNLALVIGTHSWREQFIEAVTVRSGDLQTGRGGAAWAARKPDSVLQIQVQMVFIEHC